MTGERALIDWHTHVWLPEHHTAVLMTEKQQRLGAGPGDPDSHAEAMKVVDKHVVVGVQWGELGENIPNEFVAAQVARGGENARGFCSVQPLDDGALDEVVRSIEVLGLHGLKMSPTYQGWDPRDDRLQPFFALAAERGFPIMLHVGGAYPSGATLEHGNPVRLDPIARAYPQLRLIIAHFGQPYLAETVMLLRKHENVFADLSARFHRPLQLYNGLILAIEYGVTGKLLFGSDFPVRTPAQSVEMFRAMAALGGGTGFPTIPEELIEQIMFERPFSLLGL